MALTIKLDMTYSDATETWATMREQARRHHKFAQSEYLPDSFRELASRQAGQEHRERARQHFEKAAQLGQDGEWHGAVGV